MSNLHQLMSDREPAIGECLAIVRPGDEILLVGDGVRALVDDIGKLAGVTGQLTALAADARDHGVELRASELEIRLVEDDVWVEKVTLHEQVLSWL